MVLLSGVPQKNIMKEVTHSGNRKYTAPFYQLRQIRTLITSVNRELPKILRELRVQALNSVPFKWCFLFQEKNARVCIDENGRNL